MSATAHNGEHAMSYLLFVMQAERWVYYQTFEDRNEADNACRAWLAKGYRCRLEPMLRKS
jgi:hypothetical protein